MVLGLSFLIVIALPLGLGSFVLLRGLTRTRRCPRCTADTLRLRSRPHRLASRLFRGEELHRRWCMRCGWRGTARLPVLVPVGAGGGAPGTEHASPRRAPDRVELRRIEVDGLAWRVMFECRSTAEGWVAELVFVAPGGRMWADDEPITGRTAAAVLSRAFGLSEQALAGRLRRVLH